MIYKEMKQKENKEKIERLIVEYGLPEDFADYFRCSSIKSNQALLNYLSTINNFFDWCFTNVIESFDDISKITPRYIIKYLDGLVENGYKLSTVETKQNQLTSFFRYLVEEKIIESSPMTIQNSKRYSTKKKKNHKKLPSNEDLGILEQNLSRIPNPISKTKYLTIFRLLIGSGIREIELCGLDIDDLDLDLEAPSIHVMRKGSYYAEEKERIMISNTAANALRDWLKVRSNLNPKCDAVFLNRNGDRLIERNIIKCINKYSCGKITPHMLRHWYSTELLRQTGDYAFVQEQVGHVPGSSITLNVYAHGTDESKKILHSL